MSEHPERELGDHGPGRRGVVLLITLVILVILATLGYTLSVRVAARRHRDQFIIDYGKAQYACASGIKYALASMKDLKPELISRPNEPDFSDVFALSEPEYQELLGQLAQNVLEAGGDLVDKRARGGRDRLEDPNDANGVGLARDPNSGPDPTYLSGPYGPRWPLVTEPLEFEIASAKVKVEIEDENAKYPLGWVLIDDENLLAEADVGFVTFCEWMGYRASEIDGLKEDLVGISEKRPFKLEFKPLKAPTPPPPRIRTRISRSKTSATARRTATPKTVTVAQQVEQQNVDFAKLFHCSLIDTDLLSRPSAVSESRKESAMKYLGLWATRQVNINTAPRHVLEAAFCFGSVVDSPKMAEAVIQQRRIKPFASIDEVKHGLLQFSDSIEKCKDMITTASTVFTVKVTATSGVATASAVAGIGLEGDKLKRIAVISD